VVLPNKERIFSGTSSAENPKANMTSANTIGGHDLSIGESSRGGVWPRQWGAGGRWCHPRARQGRVRRATTSMWGVWGNMSIGWTASSR
jgi:hypothetical protein